VLDEIYDLFIDLNADDKQLEFPVIYASGRDGWAVKELEDEHKNLVPLLDTIVENIPQPELREGTVQLQITSLDYNDYVGRIGVGRVFRGTLNKNNPLSIIKRDGTIHNISIKQLFVFEGLEQAEINEVAQGDICAIVGVDDVDIGDTIADGDNPEPLPIIAIDEPTISMNFTVNTSPFKVCNFTAFAGQTIQGT
jgi:GTP-binding protein